MIDSKQVNCSLVIYSRNVMIKNSLVNGTIMTNSSTASVTVQDSTVNGGSSYQGVFEGSSITIIRSNVYGGEHSVHCADNCTVQDSYLHDQYDGSAQDWHQNGFLSNGGSNYTLIHNSIACVGGCTADVALLNDGNQTNATVDKNLLVAAPSSSFCSYPAGGSTSKAGIARQISWTNNVFQKGSNKKCGYYGAIYAWSSQTSNPNQDGYQNVWSGNKWDDGSALNP